MSIRFCAVTCAAFSLAASASAGQLAPPAGVIQATRSIPLHPQELVFPYVISTPGHYILTGNVLVPFGVDGFIVSTGQVTLDLGGFQIQSEDPDAPATAIVEGAGSRSDIRIRNGAIIGFSSGIISLPTARLSTIEDVFIIDSQGGDGIVLGQECVVRRCRVRDCGLSGVVIGARGAVEDTIVTECGDRGIATGSESAVRRSAALASGGSGILVDTSSIVESCISASSSGSGILAGSGTIVRHCSATGNTGDGIGGGASTRIEGCMARGNGQVGIGALLNSVIRNCSTTQNGLVGMRARTGTSIIDCSIVDELAIGALVEGEMVRCAVLGTGGKGVSLEGAGGRIVETRIDGATLMGIELVRPGDVVGCDVRNCGQSGVFARTQADGSRIIGNLLRSNGLDNAGIVPVVPYGGVRIESGCNDCIIDGNTAIGNAIGFSIDPFVMDTSILRNVAQLNDISLDGNQAFLINDLILQDVTSIQADFLGAGPLDNIGK